MRVGASVRLAATRRLCAAERGRVQAQRFCQRRLVRPRSAAQSLRVAAKRTDARQPDGLPHAPPPGPPVPPRARRARRRGWRGGRAATGRYRRGLAAKLTGQVRVPNPEGKPVAWFHGVSRRRGAPSRRRRPRVPPAAPGLARRRLVHHRHRAGGGRPAVPRPARGPLAVRLLLGRRHRPRPRAAAGARLGRERAVAELAGRGQARGVPVVVVNGRMSPRSFARRLARVAGLARRGLFDNVARFAMQDEDYAERLRHLGVPAERVAVTGSVKYDGADGDRDTPRGRGAAAAAGPPPARPRPPRRQHARARKSRSSSASSPACDRASRTCGSSSCRGTRTASRKSRSWSARSGLPFVRRSRITEPLPEMPAVVLLDTVGELGAAWGLADVGFTGGSLDGVRGGQSMIEPAGYGVPCAVRPARLELPGRGPAAGRGRRRGHGRRTQPSSNAPWRNCSPTPPAGSGWATAARDLVRRQQGATRPDARRHRRRPLRKALGRAGRSGYGQQFDPLLPRHDADEDLSPPRPRPQARLRGRRRRTAAGAPARLPARPRHVDRAARRPLRDRPRRCPGLPRVRPVDRRPRAVHHRRRGRRRRRLPGPDRTARQGRARRPVDGRVRRRWRSPAATRAAWPAWSWRTPRPTRTTTRPRPAGKR